MVSQEIRNNAAALGVLMHQVSEEQAAMLRLIKTNLVAAADHAEELEHGLQVPGPKFKVAFTVPDLRIDEEKLMRTKIGLIRLLGGPPQDCTGVCEGCAHAQTKEM
jgi:hypothetical protein